MPRGHHKLKTWPEYYQAIEAGDKLFEVRKNDRDFKVYDILYLQEWFGGDYSGREMVFEVRYILHGGQFGIEPGYCVMQLKPMGG